MKKIAIIFLILSFIKFSICYSKLTDIDVTKGHIQITREMIINQSDVPVYGFKIIHSYPHSQKNYTEGLVMDEGFLYEGTGLFGYSHIFKTDLNTAQIVASYKLNKQYFGEGITILNDNLYQITLNSNIGFIYDKNTLSLKGKFSFPIQGWGLTTDGKSLIMSNGSSTLIFLDPKTFKQKKSLKVSFGKINVGYINELEYINGQIYSNIFLTNFIAIISPKSGKVVAWIDLIDINPEPFTLTSQFVLNGIAYDKKTNHLLVTGKTWPKIYEIELTLNQKNL